VAHALAILTVGFALIAAQPSPVRVVLETEAGEIEIEVDTMRAPITAANFLKYVDAGLYNGGIFHRTVRPDNQETKLIKIDVIQAQADPSREAEYPPAIPLERTKLTGILHKDGTVSMARAADIDSGRAHIFICIGDQPSLDYGGKRNPDGQGFAAFGRVVRGMDVVRKIQMSPARGESLRPAIKIVRARRVTA
jgi:peptidyl-prolyl cis-trans isomerase A (cyclophilin A)